MIRLIGIKLILFYFLKYESLVLTLSERVAGCMILNVHDNIGNETARVRIALNPTVIWGHMRTINPLHNWIVEVYINLFIES